MKTEKTRALTKAEYDEVFKALNQYLIVIGNLEDNKELHPTLRAQLYNARRDLTALNKLYYAN